MMRWLFGPKSPRDEFERRRADFLRMWFYTAARSGSPRGLHWVSWIDTGSTVWAKDRAGGRLLALVPAVLQFEPVEGGAMEDVPQAREPRAVVAVFRYGRGVWETDGRAIFNLDPQRAIERSDGRWVPA